MVERFMVVLRDVLQSHQFQSAGEELEATLPAMFLALQPCNSAQSALGSKTPCQGDEGIWHKTQNRTVSRKQPYYRRGM